MVSVPQFLRRGTRFGLWNRWLRDRAGAHDLAIDLLLEKPPDAGDVAGRETRGGPEIRLQPTTAVVMGFSTTFLSGSVPAAAIGLVGIGSKVHTQVSQPLYVFDRLRRAAGESSMTPSKANSANALLGGGSSAACWPGCWDCRWFVPGWVGHSRAAR